MNAHQRYAAYIFMVHVSKTDVKYSHFYDYFQPHIRGGRLGCYHRNHQQVCLSLDKDGVEAEKVRDAVSCCIYCIKVTVPAIVFHVKLLSEAYVIFTQWGKETGKFRVNWTQNNKVPVFFVSAPSDHTAFECQP